MTSKKNALKNKKKAAEKERLEKKRLGIEDEPEEETVEEKKPKRVRDSKGKAIPTEKQRKQNASKIISFDDAKKKADPAKSRVERIESYSKPKHKVKYVLDPAAKKWLIKVGTIVGVIVIALVITIASLNAAEAAKKNANNTITAEEVAQSMVGLTPEGRKLIDYTGKYDTFMLVEGFESYRLFDQDITAEEAEVLASRGQTIRDGIVGYNEEISTSAKIRAEEEAEQAEAEQEGQG